MYTVKVGTGTSKQVPNLSTVTIFTIILQLGLVYNFNLLKAY